MKRSIIGCMVLFICVAAVTACSSKNMPNRREIDEMELVRVVGIDKSPADPEMIQLSAASKEQSTAGNKGGELGTGKPKSFLFLSEGKTVFDAARTIQTHTDKKFFWGHVDFILMGEEAARDDIGKYLDFFSRDGELRLDTRVFLVKGTSARELLEKVSGSEVFVADQLKSLEKNVEMLSISEAMELIELMEELDKGHSAGVVPSLFLTEHSGEHRGSSEEKTKNIEVDGYAVIKEFKLIDFVGRPYSRGYNFIKNKARSMVIEVEDPAGKAIALELIDSRTRIIPEFEGDQLKKVIFETTFSSNIDEVHSRADVFNEETLTWLEEKQSQKIKEEMEYVIALAQKNKADFLDLGHIINMKHPYKWHAIKEQWNKIFPDLKTDVKVKSKIMRTYDIKEPIGYQGGQ